MSGNKYLSNAAGILTEVAANQSSAGAGDAGKIPALDSTGHLDTSIMPVGIGADIAVLVASESLSAGDFVNVWNSSSTFKVRKADAATNKPTHGFVLAAVESAANATVYFEGQNTQVSGATPGVQYLSDTTPGGFTATAPTTSAHLVQRIGPAVSATVVFFNPAPEIVLA